MKNLQQILQTPIVKGYDVWIADTARVFGLVTLGNECSVWFGAVLRGDGDTISVGDRSNIQENAVVHVDPSFPTQIGTDCIVGHGAIVHGATLGNHVLVGMHATVLNGAQVGSSTACTQNFNSTNRVILGAELANPTYFAGYLQDVRITKGIARYTQNFTPPTTAFLTL